MRRLDEAIVEGDLDRAARGLGGSREDEDPVRSTRAPALPQDVEQVDHRTAQAPEAAPATPEHREQG
jgi:hypothetical protein